ncbi:hypothetical protein [Caldicellulosiruptor naganoensis]|uniref:Uncharacterized protein n=1 Tax=Caldicellulosiruptor naganoensis TaxID=29324 RepID=A0ABY7BFR5_9FIRM|nr:hypothetical protein [Caldicellulosiruptor naganoensis]WAM31662.1 hypothetical protein OTJ99_000093 [Caldicellulosiruptor naganoensis]
MENKRSYYSWIVAGCITSILLLFVVYYFRDSSFFKEDPLSRIIQLLIVVGIGASAIIDAECVENSNKEHLRILLKNFLLFFIFFFLLLNIGLLGLKIIPSMKDFGAFISLEVFYTYSFLRSNYLYILKFKNYKNYPITVILSGSLLALFLGITFPDVEGIYRYLSIFVVVTILFELLNLKFR